MKLYMFRAYLGPSSGGKPYVYNNLYLLFFLDDCLLSWLDWLTKYTKNNLCIKLVLLYTISDLMGWYLTYSIRRKWTEQRLADRCETFALTMKINRGP